MIDFIKNYMFKPSYQLTSFEKLMMGLIIIGSIFILSLIIWGIWSLVVAIKDRKKEKKNGRKKNV